MARAYVALILVQVFFALWPTAGAKAMQAMTPAAVIGWRTLMGAPILMLLAAREPRPSHRDIGILAVLAVFAISANQLLFAEGLLRAGPINAVVLAVCIPVIAMVVATILGRERPSARRVFGMVVTLAGVLILVRAERFDLSDRRLTGNLFLLGNTTVYAIFLVLSKPVISRVGTLASTGWLFFFGAIEALPWTGPAVLSTPWSSLSTIVWLSLIFILLAPTIGAYLLNAYALSRIDASIVAIFYALQPLIGAFAAWWFLDEVITMRTAVAGVLIIAGVLLATLTARVGSSRG